MGYLPRGSRISKPRVLSEKTQKIELIVTDSGMLEEFTFECIHEFNIISPTNHGI